MNSPALQETAPNILVCFAVKEEAKFFNVGCRICITGMGRKNAEKAIRKAIAELRPERVITAGFAGGLNPALKLGTVIYEEDAAAGSGPGLGKLGATPAKFHCHDRVAITASEKRALQQSTGADAVEMESGIIRAICREHQIPGATVRVISDDAGSDLPLDFNALMTSDDRINFPKLILTVLRHPGKIGQLMAFQRQTITAAKNLGTVLKGIL